MSSDIWQPKISGYVDAELSEQEMRAMDSHLRECSACAAEALGQLQLKLATKQAAQSFTPSAEFRRKIADQVAARKPARSRWGWAPLLAIATIILIVAGALLNRSSQHAHSQQLLAELT